jgi:DnaK suppressor protein
MKKGKTAKAAKTSKPVKKKAAGGFKKFAAKAMKLVKGAKSKAAKPKMPVKAKPVAKAAPAPKPAPVKAAAPAAKAAPARRHASRNATPFRGGTGSTLTEADVRRMPESAYMNDTQLEFFRTRLLQMRSEVVDREVDVKERLHQRESFADPADRATAEEEHWLDLRLRERESLLLRKIDDALRRIRDREYGYCEVTGEAIGIPRLLARPTATVCVDVKGQNEQIESQFRDR